MTIEVPDLRDQPDIVEDIEKASTRLVCQALWDYRDAARDIFDRAKDLAGTVGEDITRDALDTMGLSRIPGARLIGKIDYKRAAYYFHPRYSVKQALFVDSKAEKGDVRTATIQTSQCSMRIRFLHGDQQVDEQGKLEPALSIGGDSYLTTTLFVKYHYHSLADGVNELRDIIVCCLPNGMLQTKYNPTCTETIWMVGRHAPSRKEEFRVRINFRELKRTANWRVQTIRVSPEANFAWEE
jgi:hypothetical protein